MIKSAIKIRVDVLQSWLKVTGCTQSQLANELHISRSRISQLLCSDQEPSAHLIAKFMILTQLPFERLFKIIHRPLPARNKKNKKGILSRRPSNGNGGGLVVQHLGAFT